MHRAAAAAQAELCILGAGGQEHRSTGASPACTELQLLLTLLQLHHSWLSIPIFQCSTAALSVLAEQDGTYRARTDALVFPSHIFFCLIT